MSSNDSSGSDSGREVVKKVGKTHKKAVVCDYEKQRLKRMAENKARMEAMGLHKMASSLMGCAQNKTKNRQLVKGKTKVVQQDDDDEDYEPQGDDNDQSEADDDDDYVGENSFGTKLNKAKKKNSTSSKKVANKYVSSNSNFVDDDDEAALMQAIALSLQDSSGFTNVVDRSPSKSSSSPREDCDDKIKGSSQVKEDTGRRKRKKPTSSRVQMTEDELILHFFEFDEGGQGSIRLHDLRRVAAAHDFTWSDKEMADMIQIFDSDCDGKLSLEDFTSIVGRCQMIQPVAGSKSN